MQQAYADRLLGEIETWRSRYDALLEKYHALKASGAAPELSPLTRPERDPVIDAITYKAGTDSKLRSIMIQAAMAQRAADKSDEEIIKQIESGIADDEGIP